MKRVIAFLLLAVVLFSTVALLASCKKEIKCDLCGKTKTTTPHDVTIAGKECTVCEECYKNIQDAKDKVNELIK